MKCKNCGANYSSRELCCPYCETPNPRGVLWYRQRKSAMDSYEHGLKLLPLLRRVAINRILNRVLIAEAALFVLVVIGIFFVFFVHGAVHDTKLNLTRTDILQQAGQLYEEKRYGELYHLLQENDMVTEEYYEYSQMALLYNDYEQFDLQRLEYFSQIEGGELNQHTIEGLIDSIHDVLHPYIPAYAEITDSNFLQIKEYQADVQGFAQGVFRFDAEEMALFEQDYLTATDKERLKATAERRQQNE